jgi:hypothetical protein
VDNNKGIMIGIFDKVKAVSKGEVSLADIFKSRKKTPVRSIERRVEKQ